MKTKVLYIVTKADVGGAQKYVADLTGKLDPKIYEAKILYGGQDLEWLSNQVWPWAFFLNDWLAIGELIKTFKRERPRILHLNSSKTGILGSLAAFIYNRTNPANKVRVIFSAHGWVFNPTNILIAPIRNFYLGLHKIAARFQDKIICVSEYDYDLARKKSVAPSHKLVMIHNGIGLDQKFLEKNRARQEIISFLKNNPIKINSDWPWIGSIGRLVKEKNYETLIRAAALIPRAYFFLIGQGPESEKLKSDCQKLNLGNRVFFVPGNGQDARYLKAFDIFAMSSVKEGLPYILLEAMLAGLPTVITEAGGMPELIKNHENGLMVAQKNPALLANAIQGLLINPNVAGELSKMSQKIVKEKFGLETMVQKTADLYSGLINS